MKKGSAQPFSLNIVCQPLFYHSALITKVAYLYLVLVLYTTCILIECQSNTVNNPAIKLSLSKRMYLSYFYKFW